MYTFSAVSPLSDPLVIDALEMPGFPGVVAGNHDLIITAVHPARSRGRDVWAPCGCKKGIRNKSETCTMVSVIHVGFYVIHGDIDTHVVYIKLT